MTKVLAVIAGAAAAVATYVGLAAALPANSDPAASAPVAVPPRVVTVDARAVDARPAAPPNSRDARPPVDARLAVVTLLVEVGPPSATLRVDGAPIVDGRVVGTKNQTIMLEVSAPGFQAVTESIRLEQDETRTIQLKKIGAAKKPPRAPKPRRPKSSQQIDL